MATSGRLTDSSAHHAVVSDPLHQIHQKQQKARAARKLTFFPVEIKEPGESYPDFKSDLSGVSSGRNFEVEGKELKELERNDWISRLLKAGRDYSWFHQRQVRKGAVGYYVRKVKDRVKLSETDRIGRAETDVARYTAILRPDHSRMIEKLLAAGLGKKLEPILAEVRLEKIRLFEEVYQRRVTHVGEHPDSGQYHNDLWHHGISECEVEDSGATQRTEVVDGTKQKILEGGKKEKVRVRVPFRAFGVSIGMASFDRHRTALMDGGMEESAVLVLQGRTAEVLKRNAASAEKQNKEPPRDLRMHRALDKFVGRKLRELSPQLYDEALDEYCDWIRKGYGGGHLGVADLVDASSDKKVLDEISAELDRKKREGEQLATRVETLEAENSGLMAIRDTVRSFFEEAVAMPMRVSVLQEAGMEIWKAFLEMMKALGVGVPNTVSGPGPGALQEENELLKAQVKSLTKEGMSRALEMEKLEKTLSQMRKDMGDGPEKE